MRAHRRAAQNNATECTARPGIWSSDVCSNGGCSSGAAEPAIVKKAARFLVSAALTGAVMVVISFFIEDPGQARGTLFTGLIAACAIAAIPIYDIDSWSLGLRSLVHFLVMLATVFPLLLLSGWFTVPVAIGAFLLVGVAGWSVGYVAHRIQEHKRPS